MSKHKIYRYYIWLSLLLIVLAFDGGTAYSALFSRQRPNISVHEAIRIAEGYIADNKIDVSGHFISSVQYLESGSWTESFIGKGPYWQVTYELVQLSMGGQHFVLIYMNGKVGSIGGR